MHKTGESVDYRIAAWRFPKSWGTPQIIQVMDDQKPQGAMAGSLRWVCIPSGIVERHKAHGMAELFEIFAISNR